MTAQKQSFFKISILLIAIFIGFNANAKTSTTAFLQNAPTDTIITGIVKDKDGKPLANAKVISAAGDVYTNSDGFFSITLKTVNIVPQSLFFSYDTLMPVVRSYHPVMDNAMYDVVLEPKKCCLRDLWIVAAKKDEPLTSISFDRNTTKLDAETKTKLKEIAANLKDDPEAKITATAYPPPTKPGDKIADKRLKAITEYLIEKEGISSDRIKTEKKQGEGGNGTVDFKKQ